MLGWLPEDVSTYGRHIDGLFELIYYITLVTFILVETLLVVFIVRYRQRPGRRAVYTHGNTALEIAWTIAPAVILVVLGIMSNQWWAVIKSEVPETDFQVRVTGKQFNWEILYPGPDGKFDTPDDVKFDNDLHVPVDTVIALKLRSNDVIHSFFLPNLRFKQDAVPGREIDGWFEATKVGTYEMPCAELCGFGHSGMKGYLFVHTAEEYRRWAQEKRVAAGPHDPLHVAYGGHGDERDRTRVAQ
jgi:cytochrome c oxidase subunit 2